MKNDSDEKLTISFAEGKKANFIFAGQMGDFYAPISGTLGEYPTMWFSNQTQNDLAIKLYLKGNESEIPKGSIEFLNHFYTKQNDYKSLAIKGLVSFGNLNWNTEQFTTNEEDWTLLTLLYYGQGPAYAPNFGMAFYPNEKRWIDTYCQWFVTFYNGKMVGVNRVQW
jgi:hypothetical protein